MRKMQNYSSFTLPRFQAAAKQKIVSQNAFISQNRFLSTVRDVNCLKLLNGEEHVLDISTFPI